MVGLTGENGQRGDERESAPIVEILLYRPNDEQSHKILVGSQFLAVPQPTVLAELPELFLHAGCHVSVRHPRWITDEHISSAGAHG